MKTFNIPLTEAQLLLLDTALGDRPFREVSPLIKHINQCIAEQTAIAESMETASAELLAQSPE